MPVEAPSPFAEGRCVAASSRLQFPLENNARQIPQDYPGRDGNRRNRGIGTGTLKIKRAYILYETHIRQVGISSYQHLLKHTRVAPTCARRRRVAEEDCCLDKKVDVV